MELENVEDVYPLSPIQKGLLYHSIQAPSSGVNIEQICFTITDHLDVERLKLALANLVTRHEVLRTVFVWDGLDEPLQVVREQIDIPWEIEDWSNLDLTAQQTGIEEYLTGDRIAGFDLARAPLMRIKLVRLSDEKHRLIWTTHHLLLDGWSVSIFLKELLNSYHQQPLGEFDGPRLKYRNFVDYVQRLDQGDANTYWEQLLSDFDSPNRLIDTLSSKRSSGYARQTNELSSSLSESLNAIARDNRLTPNSVILGAWSYLLSIYSNDEDVVVGTTVSGRPPLLEGAQNAVGMFINTLPMRIRVMDEKLLSWLQGIQTQQFKLREFEHTPLYKVQQLSGIAPGTSLFETILVFENYPDFSTKDNDGSSNTSKIGFANFEFIEQSNYPLALLVVPGSTLQFQLVYDQSKFSADFCNTILQHLTETISSFITNSTGSLSDITLLPPAERRLIIEGSGTHRHGIIDHRLLHELITDTARQNTDAIAVRYLDKSLTYSELDRTSNVLAHQLLAFGGGGRQNIGLYAGRGLEMIIAIVAILKAGAAYTPLDPAYPDAHIDHVIRDAGLDLVVVSPEFNQFDRAERVVIVDLNITPCDLPPTINSGPDDLAYLIYTSGSQGQPKGVMVSHENIVYSTLVRREFYDTAPDNFLLLSSFAFDSSMVGIFWTLIEGGTIVIPANRIEQDLDRLTRLICDEQITHLLCIPSLYDLLVSHNNAANLTSLKTAIVAGEACNPRTIAKHFENLPETRFYNEYGPTEATVWCIATRLTLDNRSGLVPIGKPIAGTRVYLLDRFGNPCPKGTCGELCVTGPGVAKGYLNHPGLTDEKFVTNPFDQTGNTKMYRTGDLAYHDHSGNLIFIGRSDDQVKIRGFRIEPGEIEEALRSEGKIADAAILVASRNLEPAEQPSLRDQVLAAVDKHPPSRIEALFDNLEALSEPQIDALLKGAVQ